MFCAHQIACGSQAGSIHEIFFNPILKVATRPVSDEEYALNIQDVGGWVFEEDEALHPETSGDKNVQPHLFHGNLAALREIRKAAGHPQDALPEIISDEFMHSLYSEKALAKWKASMSRSSS